MKKRLIALVLVLCMVLSIIPVYATESTASAGTLVLDTPVTVTLDAGEEISYLFQATGGTRYYYYLTPVNASHVDDVEIRPEPVDSFGNGHSYAYADMQGQGTIFTTEENGTVEIILHNHGGERRTFDVAVTPTSNSASNITLNETSITMELGQFKALQAMFLPAFSYLEDVTFTVADESIVQLDVNGGTAALHPQNIGSTTIDVSANNGAWSETCAVTVTAPSTFTTIDTSNSVGITLPANEYSEHILSFTAPEAGRYVMFSSAEEGVRMEPVGLGTDNFIRQGLNLVIYELVKDQTVYFKVCNDGIYSGTLDVAAALCTDATEFSVAPQQGNASIGDFFYCETEFMRASEYTPVTWSTSNNQVVDIPSASLYAADFLAVGNGTAIITATTDTANPVSVSWEITVESSVSGDSGASGMNSIASYPLALNEIIGADSNADGFFNLTFTPENSGLYFIGYVAFENMDIQPISHAITPYCDHDLVTEDEVPFMGSVWFLDAGVEYVFQCEVPNSETTYEVYLLEGVEADTFTPWDTERIGYAGTDIELYYDVMPLDAFGGVRATSSDDSVATVCGGNNADPFIYVELRKPGTATITATTASGLTATTKVTVLEAPKLTLTSPLTLNIASDETSVYSFTPPHDGSYTFTITGSTNNYYIDFSSTKAEHYDGTTTYFWADLLAGVPIVASIHNYGSEADTYTVSVAETPTATAISLSEPDTSSQFGHVSLWLETTPITAYEEIIDWTVSDPSILALADFGIDYANFTILKSGKVTVTATSESGLKASKTFNVQAPTALKVNTKQTFTVGPNDTLDIAFTAPKTGYFFAEHDRQSSIWLSHYYETEISNDILNGSWTYLEKGQVWELSLTNTYSTADSYTLLIHDATAPITALNLTPSQSIQYVGDIAEILLTVDPIPSYDFESILFSDPSIVEDAYFSGYSLHVVPAKAGTTEVTLTTTGGVSAKCTLNFQEPIALTLDQKESVTLVSDESVLYSFDAVAGQQYAFYCDHETASLSVVSEFPGSLVYHTYEVSEDTTYECILFAPEVSGPILFRIYNWEEEALTTSVGVTKTVKPTEISLQSFFSTLYVGQNADLRLLFRPLFAYDQTITFKVKGDAVSIFYAENDFCTIYGQKTGTATVTATTSDGLTASRTFTVLEPGTVSANTDTALTLQKDCLTAFRFTVPEDGTYDITSTGLFVFDVHFEEGLAVYGASPAQQSIIDLVKGDTILVVVYAESDTSGTFNIHKHTGHVADITLPVVNGVAGSQQTVFASFTPADAYLEDWVGWSISDPTIAEIEYCTYNGIKLNFLKAGTATLTMHLPNQTYSTTINVTDSILIPADTTKPATVTPDAIDQALQEALDKAVEGKPAEVIVSVSDAATTAGVTVSKVELPVASLETVADADAVLTVQLSNATVTLDAKALDAVVKQAQGSQVVLNVEEVEVKTLNEKQQKAVSKHNVAAVITAELICTKTGKSIWTKDSKDTSGSISIQIPFTPEPGYKLKNYTVLFLDDDGKLEKIQTAYNEEAGCLIFTLKHFSSYIIARDYVEAEETMPEETTPPATNPATGDRFPLGLAILVMAMAIGAAAVVCFSKRRSVQ